MVGGVLCKSDKPSTIIVISIIIRLESPISYKPSTVDVLLYAMLLAVGYLMVSDSWSSSLNCNPWNFATLTE